MGCASSKEGAITDPSKPRNPAGMVASKAPERYTFTDIETVSDSRSEARSEFSPSSFWDRLAELGVEMAPPLDSRAFVSGDFVTIHGVPGKAHLNGTGAQVALVKGDNVLLNLEEAKPGELAVSVPRKCLKLIPPVTSLGVSLAFLEEFCHEHGDQLVGKTSAQVAKLIVKPLTERAQCSLAHALSRTRSTDPKSGRPLAAVATHYIIHSAQDAFAHLFEALHAHFKEQADSVYLSIDLFTINHHAPVERPKIWWTKVHRELLSSIGNSCLVMRPLSNPVPLERSWCLWEILSSTLGDCSLEIVLPPDEKVTVQEAIKNEFPTISVALSRVDFKAASATLVEDTETILRTVESTIGVEEANDKVLTALRKWLARMAFDMLATLSDEEWGTSSLINNLATLLKEQGRFAEAESLYRDALAARREHKGSKHPKTLLAMSNLALLLQEQGNFNEAEALFRENFEARLETLGENDPLTLMAMHNLGKVLKDRGYLSDAEKLLRSALELRTQVLGEHHKDTISTLKILGLVLHDGGKLKEAELIFYRELEAMRAVAGEHDPETLASMNNLALLLQDLENTDAALPLFRDALDLKRKVLGDRDPATLTAMNNLAMLLQDLGMTEEAEPLFREALASRQATLGATHPRTLTSMNNLAGLLFVECRFAEAEIYYRQCLEARRRMLGNGHPSTLDSMNNLALVLKEQGKDQEAENEALEYIRASGRVSEILDDDAWGDDPYDED
mmetsp:Transcript_16084/g.45155  ORF Transcript_16084/g.45155 Transcript_16084/m.45155 type:complete len:735 (+) Transcript_16084:44-2248(+)